MTTQNEYWERERLCEQAFSNGGPFYIISTENLPWLLYTSEEEFKDGTNIVATSLAGLRIKVLNEVEMNSHLHLVVEGIIAEIRCFEERLRLKMHRYQQSKDRPSLLKWEIHVKQIKSLTYLRNAILYVSRNPYVARRNVTPNGYKWSGGFLFFNETLSDYRQGTPWPEVSYKEKRAICRSHEIDMPEHYRVLDGMITRASFIDYRRAEEFFNSANQYFKLLAKNVEADAETARWIGEKILLPDEDVFRIVADWYRVKSVTALNMNQREEAARKMKYELMSNNKQISQVLKLRPEKVDAMFPSAQWE